MRLQFESAAFNYFEPSEVVREAVARVLKAHYGGKDNLYADITGGDTATSRTKSCRFVLRVRDSREEPARRSASGRRLPSANWEAHKHVLREIFNIVPTATIVSALATYRGKADFEQNHGVTYDHNAGSMMRPVAFGEL